VARPLLNVLERDVRVAASLESEDNRSKVNELVSGSKARTNSFLFAS